MDIPHIKVAAGVMIFKEGKVLIIRRKGSLGAGEYAFPGGKLDYKESLESCARREVLEETNIDITNVRFVNIINSISYEQHFVVAGFIADWGSGEATIMEPEKCDYIGWHDVTAIPQPFFEHSQLILDGYFNKINFYDK